MRPRPRGALTLAAAILTLAACGQTGSSPAASVTEATSTAGATPSAAPTLAAVTSPTASTTPLPEPIDIDEAGAQRIRATTNADWMVVVDGSAYVAGLGDGIGRLDASGEMTGSAELTGWCEAMDVGFGAIWSATCEPSGLARIDPESLEVTTVTFEFPTEDSEGSVGAGEDAVWAMTGSAAARRLLKVDPDTLETVGTYPMPSGAGPVRAGLGGVWVTCPAEGVLYRVEPASGEVTDTIPVGPVPRFLAVGEDGVWVMNQGDGTVSHVDPETRTVVATMDVGQPIHGGDIAVGGGSVWVRGGPELLARIDPSTDQVIERYGPPPGSGSVAADDAAVWATAHDIARIWRLPLD